MYAVKDTLKGLNQLHECGYVAHCDIKKENIGYDEKSKNFKILDLDSAIKCSPNK
jgi:serine/threonine protein kinase